MSGGIIRFLSLFENKEFFLSKFWLVDIVLLLLECNLRFVGFLDIKEFFFLFLLVIVNFELLEYVFLFSFFVLNIDKRSF